MKVNGSRLKRWLRWGGRVHWGASEGIRKEWERRARLGRQVKRKENERVCGDNGFWGLRKQSCVSFRST